MARRTKYNPEKILTDRGPLLSGDLAQAMCQQYGVKERPAKKAIERAYRKGILRRVEFMTFGRGEHLYYLEKTSDSILKTIILNIIKNRRPVVYRLWRALQKERILPHRDGLKISGLSTKRVRNRESYKDVMEYLIKLKLARSERTRVGGRNTGFLVLNSDPPVSTMELEAYDKELTSHEQVIQDYLQRSRTMHIVKNVRSHVQVGNRLFDAVGEAVSRRYMVVIFDFVLHRIADDYDIEGLLDRIFSVYRKKFRQIVITYCVSLGFTRKAQQKAMTGRFKQINLIRVKRENGQLTTERIDGISIQSRG